MAMRTATLCCAVALGAFVSLAPNASTQSHFIANGDGGRVDWSSLDGDGRVTGFGSLLVSRGGPTGNPQTFLMYFVFQCDGPGCNLTEGGAGLIPNGDLSGGGRQSLRLDTNTSGAPDFGFLAGNGGPVFVEWRANGFFSHTSSGTSESFLAGPSEFSAGNFRQRVQGTSSSAKAAATGTVIGSAITPTQIAEIGTSHDVTINICGAGAVCP